MAGYTPVFSSIYDGTLFGKWPTAVVWASLLPLVDAKGEIDLSYEAIAGRTGWPMDLLRAGINDLMQPDPDSRSDAEEGRRLVLLDPSKLWGWRVVNVQKYRERSRDQNRVADGSHAEKMRRWREAKNGRDVTRSDPAVPGETGSDSTHTQTHTQTKSKRGAPKARRVPEDFRPDLEYAKTQIPDIDADREAQKFRDWEFKTPRSDWPAVWRTWVGNCRETGKYAKRETTQWR